MINQFSFYAQFSEIIDSLPKESQGEFALAIINYAFKGEKPIFTQSWMDSVFISIKFAIDTSIARSEAGKKGMKSRWTSKNNSQEKDVEINESDNKSITNGYQNHNKIITSGYQSDNKDKEKEKINKKEKIKKPKNKFSSLSSLREFEFEVTSELACKQQTTPEFVKSKLEDLENYCQRSGRVYKDYKAALSHFVKSDPKKPQYVPREKKVSRADEILAKYRLAEKQERVYEQR